MSCDLCSAAAQECAFISTGRLFCCTSSATYVNGYEPRLRRPVAPPTQRSGHPTRHLGSWRVHSSAAAQDPRRCD
eukprot:2880475-Pleurochrysis_carterae.AAC.1